jgi:CBS domain-containing protein
MLVSDLMTRKVVSVAADMAVPLVATLLVERRLSAVPVTDGGGRILGLISEADLMRRPETGTERHASWWLRAFASRDALAEHYTKSHGLVAKDIMTTRVVTIPSDASVDEAADLMERHRVKRLPVVRSGLLVGIIARADLVRALAMAPRSPAGAHDDAAVREAVEQALEEDRRMWVGDICVTVHQHTAHLWGRVESETQSDAVRVLASRVPGVGAVKNHLAISASPVASPLLIP